LGVGSDLKSSLAVRRDRDEYGRTNQSVARMST